MTIDPLFEPHLTETTCRLCLGAGWLIEPDLPAAHTETCWRCKGTGEEPARKRPLRERVAAALERAMRRSLAGGRLI